MSSRTVAGQLHRPCARTVSSLEQARTRADTCCPGGQLAPDTPDCPGVCPTPLLEVGHRTPAGQHAGSVPLLGIAQCHAELDFGKRVVLFLISRQALKFAAYRRRCVLNLTNATFDVPHELRATIGVRVCVVVNVARVLEHRPDRCAQDRNVFRCLTPSSSEVEACARCLQGGKLARHGPTGGPNPAFFGVRKPLLHSLAKVRQRAACPRRDSKLVAVFRYLRISLKAPLQRVLTIDQQRSHDDGCNRPDRLDPSGPVRLAQVKDPLYLSNAQEDKVAHHGRNEQESCPSMQVSMPRLRVCRHAASSCVAASIAVRCGVRACLRDRSMTNRDVSAGPSGEVRNEGASRHEIALGIAFQKC